VDKSTNLYHPRSTAYKTIPFQVDLIWCDCPFKIVVFQSPYPERKDEKRRQVLADTEFQAWQSSTCLSGSPEQKTEKYKKRKINFVPLVNYKICLENALSGSASELDPQKIMWNRYAFEYLYWLLIVLALGSFFGSV
jgi:hypothetical protein